MMLHSTSLQDRAGSSALLEAPSPRLAHVAGRNVSMTYRRGRMLTRALESTDLTIDEGRFVAIVGPSGCGKSTLLRMIAGLLKPTTGEITVRGAPVVGPVTELGIVFQMPVLLDWRNVLDNVLVQIQLRGLPAARYRDEAMRLLASVGLGEFCDRLPYELSGGMRQRAAIVRALIHDPPLLLMDEPFGALDALTREQMRLDLEALWLKSRKTVLFVTHSVDEAVLLADEVLVMSPRPGRIERIIPIDIPRPRGMDARHTAAFDKASEEITEIFLRRGVLQRAGTPADPSSP